MTRTQHGSGPELDSDSVSANLPSYSLDRKESYATTEKEITISTSPCKHAGKGLQTPYVDAHVRQPNVKARILALSAALTNAVEDGGCAKCATQAAVYEVTAYLRDMKAAKKEGRWAPEEKKALKKEVKGLAKEMKKDVKRVWKGKE